MTTEIVKYESNGLMLDARVEHGQAWLSYEQTAQLFGCSRDNVEKHVSAILSEGELTNSTTEGFSEVRTEGNRSVRRVIGHVNQDMVLHVGYRVRSDRGSEFRRWATSIVKGELQAPVTKTMSLAEQALMHAQVLVDQERRLAVTEQKVATLEATFAEREAKAIEIHELPEPAVPAPPKTCGQLTVEVVRGWGNSNNLDFNGGFNKLYRDVEYRLGIDLKTRKRNKPKLRMMDIIDASGKSLEIYSIACELFRPNKTTNGAAA